ncbi:GNAT family N-acetyltransferase [Bacteroides sp. UBA939]|uniref:GNAT family N-acetyltransferase n=1 Tax=Bacteroides sp. UBA939 TaxID=1946092 RepID=UPI0025C241F7|nr:GNAT family N-acetyltransferase [Bacteroides sp. UBA939]
MEEDYELIDNEKRHQYELHIKQYIPKIEYIKSSNGEIYLTHTEVPVPIGGKGIGSQLVEKVLKNIDGQGLKLVPLCPFVSGYIHKHPEWKRIILKGSHIQ